MKLGLINIFKDEFAPPLGLASIATYLSEYGNFEGTKIIDINYDDIFKEAKKYRPDVIGISSMSHYYNEAINTAKKIKEERDIPIFVGGVHISTLPSSLDQVFDFGVIGEGEQTALELVRLYEQKGEFSGDGLKDIKGLVYRKDGKLVLTENRDPIKPLDKIPIPDRGIINKQYFRKRWIAGELRKTIGATILTSRGCPYRCVFCSTSRFWQKLRFNSPERVCDEVEYLVNDYGVEHIQIWDDLFTMNMGRLKKIAELFKKRGIDKKVSFHCQPRANLMSDELCQIMKEINVSTINFGFESGSEKILNYLKAGSVSVEDNKRAIILGKKHGFAVVGSLIFGSPGETIEDMEETLEFIDFADKNKADNLWHFVMTPFPGTPIWEIAKERGAVSDDMDWDLLRHSNVEMPLLLDPSIDKNEFKEIYDRARWKIYKLRTTRENWVKSKIMRDPVRLVRQVREEPLSAIKLFFRLTKKILKRR